MCVSRFYPDEFLYVHVSQFGSAEVHPEVHACGFRYVRTHTRTQVQPIVTVQLLLCTT